MMKILLPYRLYDTGKTQYHSRSSIESPGDWLAYVYCRNGITWAFIDDTTLNKYDQHKPIEDAMQELDAELIKQGYRLLSEEEADKYMLLVG